MMRESSESVPPTAYLNRVATAVPSHDVHGAFLQFGRSLLCGNPREASLFERMAERAAIEHRYSCLAPARRSNATEITAAEFYRAGAFPGPAARMELFEAQAPLLGPVAVEQLALGSERRHITHMLTTCCTGFSAPGLDQQIIARCGLPSTIERTMIGFMGCYAAINALKVARHIVRSEPSSRVLIVNLELCSLHLNETAELGELLSFLIFGDGCAASVVSADPTGFSLDRFRALSVPDTGDLITWSIRDHGFDMVLSGQVPGAILDALSGHANEVLDGAAARSIDLWAVHPGGRSVLDAVERAFNLDPPALRASREVLRRFGNMSSSTVMFVFESLLRTAARGSSGCAMAFGPGLTAETMLFRAAA